jgi:hypothetical protein
MGSIRQSLQAQPKNIKKLSKYQINQSKSKKSQIKVFLVLQKCKGAKNSLEGYPTEFAGSTQNPKKLIETPNLPIKTKIFPKKNMFSSLKLKICISKNNRTQVKFRKTLT